MKMIRRYITDNPKVIVLTRPVDEVVRSFVELRQKNGWIDPAAGLLDPMSEPIMRSQFGVDYARATNKGEFLFIDYAELTTDTDQVLESIYAFAGFDSFTHDLTNIINRHPEDDTVYGLAGMHDVRSIIGAR